MGQSVETLDIDDTTDTDTQEVAAVLASFMQRAHLAEAGEKNTTDVHRRDTHLALMKSLNAQSIQELHKTAKGDVAGIRILCRAWVYVYKALQDTVCSTDSKDISTFCSAVHTTRNGARCVLAYTLAHENDDSIRVCSGDYLVETNHPDAIAGMKCMLREDSESIRALQWLHNNSGEHISLNQFNSYFSVIALINLLSLSLVEVADEQKYRCIQLTTDGITFLKQHGTKYNVGTLPGFWVRKSLPDTGSELTEANQE